MRVTPQKAENLLLRMKPKVFEDLHLSPSPRTERVFDAVSDMVMWSLVDGHHTEETVSHYLTFMVKSQMDKGAFAHLGVPSMP